MEVDRSKCTNGGRVLYCMLVGYTGSEAATTIWTQSKRGAGFTQVTAEERRRLVKENESVSEGREGHEPLAVRDCAVESKTSSRRRLQVTQR